MSEPNLSPPAAQPAHAGGPPETTMSTPETLANIFFEPGRTFEALRARPRFLVAALICIVLFMAGYIAYMQRVGYERVIDAETNVARKTQTSVTEEQLQQNAQIQKTPVVKAIRMWSPLLIILIVIAAGAGIYTLGTNLMGGKMSYKQGLSVWSYSSLPPLLLTIIVGVVLLFLRPPDDDQAIVQGLQQGLVRANAGAFVDAAAHPVLAALLGAIDILAFYGLWLGAVGLRKVGRLTSGSAWTIVLALWGIGVLLRVVLAFAFGGGGS